MFELNLVFSLSPESFGYSHKSIWQKDDNKKHTKRVWGSHEDGHEFSETKFAFEDEVNHEEDTEGGKDSINDEIVDDGHFKAGLYGELTWNLVFLGNR